MVWCSVSGDSASPIGLKVAWDDILEIYAQKSWEKFVAKVIFLPSLEGYLPTIKTYLSSPEAPKNLEVRVRQSPRTLTLSCLRATPQCRRVFFLFFWVILGGRFTVIPFIEILAIVNNQ